MAVKKKGLGRGLDSLIINTDISLEDTEKDVEIDGLNRLDINSIRPNENQPRKVFDPEKIEEVFEFGSRVYADDPTYNVKTYDGMKEVLEGLKARGMKLAVITNKPHVSAPAVIERFFGEGLFDVVQGQQEGLAKKPDPGCVEGILKELEVKPEECCYFGDSDTDMKLGKAVGFYTVGVTWGFRSREELEENNADMIIDEPEKIAEVC